MGPINLHRLLNCKDEVQLLFSRTFLKCLTLQHCCQLGSSSRGKQTKTNVGQLSYQENAELQLNPEHCSEKPCFSTLVSLHSGLQTCLENRLHWVNTMHMDLEAAKCSVLFCRTRCQTTANMNILLLFPALPPYVQIPCTLLSENHVTSCFLTTSVQRTK